MKLCVGVTKLILTTIFMVDNTLNVLLGTSPTVETLVVDVETLKTYCQEELRSFIMFGPFGRGIEGRSTVGVHCFFMKNDFFPDYIVYKINVYFFFLPGKP